MTQRRQSCNRGGHAAHLVQHVLHHKLKWYIASVLTLSLLAQILVPILLSR